MSSMPSVLKQLANGDLRVSPIIAIDFSATESSIHSQDTQEPNEFRELLQMMMNAYGNILNVPIFGYGARTSSFVSMTS
jgi:hypothetical protein